METGGTEADAPGSLRSLLSGCDDERLLSVLPALLRALPGTPARRRCLAAARQALVAELASCGSKFCEDETSNGSAISAGLVAAAEANWRRILTPAGSPTATSVAPAATASAAGRRPASRAMAMPFLTQAVAKEDESRQAKESVQQQSERLDDPETEADPDEADQGEDHQGHPEEEASADAVSATAVFVANMPYLATEQQLREFFEQHNGTDKVETVRMHMTVAGKAKGTAVVSFADATAAKAAVALSGELLGDRELLIKADERGGGKGKAKGKGKGKTKGKSKARSSTATPEQDARSVIVKNLAFNASEANIGELFAGCGDINAVRIAKDSRSGRPKGFAVVEFSSEASLKEALARSGRELRGRAVRVEAVWTGEELDPSWVSKVEKEEAELEDGSAEKSKSEQPEAGEKAPEAPSEAPSEAQLEDAAPAEDTKSAEEPVVQSPAAAAPVASDAQESLRRHAQQLLAKGETAAADVEPPQKRRKRGEGGAPAAAETFAGGEDGLRQVVELVGRFDGPEALLAAQGAEELKGRLAALGLKSGGTPLDRAKRLMQLNGLACLSDVPKELLTKGAALRAPVKFVRGSEGTEQEAAKEAATESKAADAAMVAD
eukprot:TRINITY_DN91138_c0_g1_i1.p1 TRINITY_DN91138_c0_g1~~TRINITY_DN91138_c0_g1_i1.p1  ORF type:complete len:619 (-),score=199.56 TRINITY_DN91138_c0_g1_i1:46-1875(-)